MPDWLEEANTSDTLQLNSDSNPSSTEALQKLNSLLKSDLKSLNSTMQLARDISGSDMR